MQYWFAKNQPIEATADVSWLLCVHLDGLYLQMI